MSKYIIDTETWANLFEVQRVGVYGIGNDIATDEKTVWSRMFSLDELEELNSDYINENFGELQDEAYQRGHDDGYEAGCASAFKPVSDAEYQRGLEDAWEAARKIALMDTKTSENITGYFGLFRIMENLTPMQAIAKLKAYEDKHSDRIEVGDEVIAPCGKAVVTLIETDYLVHYLYSGGDYGCIEPQKLKKTGKHYDIQSILEAMRNDR